MNVTLMRLVAPLLVLCFTQLACYNKYRISTSELEKLESGNIAETVLVDTTGGASVEVRATTPVQITTTNGERHNVSPFNFALTDRQLVAPDYDLLLDRNNVDGATVSQMNRGRTIGLIVGGVAVAAGGFALISVLAGSESDDGFSAN